MPIYEYCCSECSLDFTELRPMARSAEPAACPACSGYAPRLISAPRLNTMRPEARKAHQTNERSAHQPRVTQPHRCGAGCSHNHGESKPVLKQSSTTKRPWMIGH